MSPEADILGPIKSARAGRTPPEGPWRLKAEGLRVVLRPIRGVTPRKLLDGPFRFQCPPLSEFTVQFSQAHSEYQTIERGTFSEDAGPELTVVSFDTLVTEADENWVIAKGMYNPKLTTKVLHSIKRTGAAVRMTCYHGFDLPVELDMPVTLRQFTVSEREGEVEARYFNVSFAQWRDIVVRRKDKRRWPIKHKLTVPQTLYDLARKYYGRPSLASHIGRHNRGLRFWGRRTRITAHRLYSKGDIIRIPRPPDKGGGKGKRDRALHASAHEDDVNDWLEQEQYH